MISKLLTRDWRLTSKEACEAYLFVESVPKNSSGFMIRIFRKGLSSNKSSSPLIIHVALPLIASSKNLSSFGSRQARMFSLISTSVVSRSNAIIKDSRSSRSRYRLNYSRHNTSFNSFRIGSERRISPRSCAA